MTEARLQEIEASFKPGTFGQEWTRELCAEVRRLRRLVNALTGELVALGVGTVDLAEPASASGWPPCGHCGCPVNPASAVVGADGVTLYSPACWRIVSNEGRP